MEDVSEREFISCRIAILTLSDTRTLQDDKSGELLKKRILAAGHTLADRKILQEWNRSGHGFPGRLLHINRRSSPLHERRHHGNDACGLGLQLLVGHPCDGHHFWLLRNVPRRCTRDNLRHFWRLQPNI